MDDAEQILQLWNSIYKRDPTTQSVLNSKFFNSNYLDAIAPVTKNGSFSLAGTRKTRFYHSEDLDCAWILCLGIGKNDDAKFLLDAQITSMRARGAKKLFYSSFTPDYFSPGVDRARYPDLHQFLEDYGFRQENEAIEMVLNLNNYEVSSVEPKDGIGIETYSDKIEGQLLSFMKLNFNADWYYRVKSVIENGDPEQVSVAFFDGEIAGFSMFSGPEGDTWYYPGERFGPFGVREEIRGKGIGTLLLKQTLNLMKGRGIQSAFFRWTDEKASHLYERFGFRETRRYSIMSLELQ